MINMLLGAPGSGKSYEAVAYHAIPALLEGRKVITNLPLVIEELEKEHPGCTDLLKIVEATAEYPIPFSDITHFGDPWRHPETGSGPLYIIDECHMPLPRKGTPIGILHWFALHRHEAADVLLLTQSHGKVDKDICDLVQILYRVRKNTALGSSGSYVRKVCDGLRGEKVNEEVRIYKKRFFPFYKSHTLGGGKELAAKDVKPIWRHWSVYCAVLVLGFFAYQWITKGNPVSNLLGPGNKPKVASVPARPLPTPSTSNQATPAASVNPVQAVGSAVTGVAVPPKPRAPFSGYGLHLVGSASSSKKQVYVIGLSQNSVAIGQLTDEEFRKAGYSFEPVNQCLAIAKFQDELIYIVCDAPRMSLGASVNSMSGRSGT